MICACKYARILELNGVEVQYRDIEEVEKRYLQPLIDVMEPVARLSIESQVGILSTSTLVGYGGFG